MAMTATFRFVRLLIPVYCMALALSASAQKQQQPKLMVGIVVDQMRSDYLEKYSEHWGENGFKRLMREGYWCKNTQYNYMPTHTGPGHSSVYTGATPSVHGIISNDWYDPSEQQVVYCASDPKMEPVGAQPCLARSLRTD